MNVLDPVIENFFKDIARSLKLGYQKTKASGGDVYNLFYKDEFLVRFSILIDRQNKFIILVNFGSMTQPPLSLGAYTKEELKTKARNTIIARIIKLIEKK